MILQYILKKAVWYIKVVVKFELYLFLPQFNILQGLLFKTGNSVFSIVREGLRKLG